MDSHTTDLPFGMKWRHVVVVAVMVLLVWWLFSRSSTRSNDAPLEPNPTPARTPASEARLPGVPQTLLKKMEAAQDANIPVVMTSGSAVEYGDNEVEDIAKAALARVNVQNEDLNLIALASVSKTIDAYKTVAYDIVANVFDTKATVGIMVSIIVLVASTGKVYLRTLRMYNDGPDPMASLGTASDPTGPATYQDPLALLASFKDRDTSQL